MLNTLMEWMCENWFGGHCWIYNAYCSERICCHCGKEEEHT